MMIALSLRNFRRSTIPRRSGLGCFHCAPLLLPLWLALSVMLPTNWSSVKVYFGVVPIQAYLAWTRLARVVRGQFLNLRE